MKIDAIYCLELTRKEVIAIKKLLGKYSPNTKTQAGLNDEEVDLTAKIYLQLSDEAE